MLEDIAAELRRKFPKVLDEHNTHIDYPFINQEGRLSPRSDLFVELSATFIAVELEDHQTHPDTNFLKYIRWIEEYRPKGRLVLIQVFSIRATARYASRRRNIDFLRTRSPKELTYFPVHCMIQTLEIVGQVSLD